MDTTSVWKPPSAATERRTPPTQRDVARRAGVSQAAVSYVLNGKASAVSPATRLRVLDAMEALAYAPNPLAQTLRGASTGLLGVIARAPSDPLTACLLEALSGKARDNMYELLVTLSGDNAAEAARLASVMKSRLCDGLLILGELPNDHEIWNDYRDIGLPVVALQQGTLPLPVNTYCVDNAQGTTAALEHLTSRRHRRIAFVKGASFTGHQERVAAYRTFMRRRRLPTRGYVVETDGTAAEDARALDRLLQHPEPPTAVLASNDTVALHILTHAAKTGIRVPKQLSVIGFDDVGPTDSYYPALTTLRQPIDALADAAIRAVIDGHDEDGSAPTSHAIPPELIERDSTGLAPV